MKRKLILLLIYILMIGILGGCVSSELPKGIENKKFLKELSSAYGVILSSMDKDLYNEEKINESVGKLNKYVNSEKINEYETLIVNTINDNINNLKYDMTHGEKIITSKTLDEFQWLIDTMSDYFKEKYNK